MLNSLMPVHALLKGESAMLYLVSICLKIENLDYIQLNIEYFLNDIIHPPFTIS